jgi:hypothetical protein
LVSVERWRTWPDFSTGQRGGTVAKRLAGLTAGEGVLGAPEQRLTPAYARVTKRAMRTGPAFRDGAFSWPNLSSGQDPQAAKPREGPSSHGWRAAAETLRIKRDVFRSVPPAPHHPPHPPPGSPDSPHTTPRGSPDPSRTTPGPAPCRTGDSHLGLRPIRLGVEIGLGEGRG